MSIQVSKSHASYLQPIFWFFLLAYLIAWSIAFTVGVDTQAILQQYSGATAFLLITLPKFAFSLAGIIVIALTKGYAGLQDVAKNLFHWRVGFKWYALAYLGPAFLYGLGVLLFTLLEPAILSNINLNFKTMGLIFFGADTGIFTYMLLRGGLGEEIGLRGFALKELQKHHSPLKASLIIGVLWAVWHLPSWWHRDLLSILIPFLAVMALSIIFTYIFKGSGESLLIVILLHASLNSFDDVYELIFPKLTEYGLWELPYILGVLMIAGVLIFRLRVKP